MKKNSNLVLVIVLIAAFFFIAVIVVLALIGGGWWYYNSTKTNQAPIEVVATDTVATTPVVAERVDDVFMNLWGSIGDSQAQDFVVEGKSGWYTLNSDSLKRTLEVTSYNSDSGRCVLNAYLNGQYIGKFSGVFKSEDVEIGDGEMKTVQSYSGTFESAKGAKLEFYLYID